VSNKKTKAARPEIYQRDACRCFYCGNELTDDELSVDHVFPLYLGGKEDRANYVTACRECNQLKGHLPPFFFMRHRRELLAAQTIERNLLAAMLRPEDVV
jgi:5-methylcytosine-specific restriction endonuclease McrA